MCCYIRDTLLKPVPQTSRNLTLTHQLTLGSNSSRMLLYLVQFYG